MLIRIPQLLAPRLKYLPAKRLLPQLTQRYTYVTSVGINAPPSLSSLNTQADMILARNWIASFSKLSADDIPRDALEISYSRSSGPGGQNVNKLSTKATVRLILSRSTTFLPRYTITNLHKSSYYTSSTSTSAGIGSSGPGRGEGGSILLSSSVHRTQPQNLADAMLKLKGIILKAASEGLVGETSEVQKKKVEGLERKEKKKMEGVKRERKDVKSGRRKGGFD